MHRCLLFTLILLGSALPVFSQSANTTDPLVKVLQTKGILTEAEARAITTNTTPADQGDRWAALLRDKGVISASEFETVRQPAAPGEMTIATADYKTSSPPPAATSSAASAAPQPTPVPVIAAVAPVRLI